MIDIHVAVEIAPVANIHLLVQNLIDAGSRWSEGGRGHRSSWSEERRGHRR